MKPDQPYSIKWLQSFKEKHHRPIRVLHIGNIANNAYNNAKLLNKAGLDCDVICYDYYHIMGCPEWEDADLEGDIKNQFYPNWTSVNLKGFKKPRWFAQGLLLLCIYYLVAKRDGKKLSARLLWSILEITRSVRCSKIYVAGWNCLRAVRKFLRFVRNNIQLVRNYLFAVRIQWFPLGRLIFYSILFVCIPFIILFYLPVTLVVLPVKIIKRIFCCFEPIETEKYSFKDRVKELVEDFAKKFPEREDKLTENDLVGYKYAIGLWRRLFSRYDIIHAYATDGIFPLLAGVPYVAYEHGTIRNIPFEETTWGRLCALTYKLADRVCITNADNIAAAKKLGLNNYRFVPHPVNEAFLAADKKSEELSASLRTRLDSNFIVFHPSRQHWEERRHPDWEKGNDIFIRGFARFALEVNPNATAVFVKWGKSVIDSMRLLDGLGIADKILWIPPQPNRRMVRYIHATDLVADQFYLGAFGSTMPKALACGKPAMLYLNFDIHKWYFDEMPPVINAGTEENVFEGLVKVYTDKGWAAQLAAEGISWYKKYHSNQVIVKRLLAAYTNVLIDNGKL
jgi:hypothetical protein